MICLPGFQDPSTNCVTAISESSGEIKNYCQYVYLSLHVEINFYSTEDGSSNATFVGTVPFYIVVAVGAVFIGVPALIGFVLGFVYCCKWLRSGVDDCCSCNCQVNDEECDLLGVCCCCLYCLLDS